MQQPDEELVRLAQRGDVGAVSTLYVRYQRKLLNYLYRLTGDRALAEDLTQETFLRVVRHLPSYRPTGSVGGWIFRIAKNLALNSFRDRKALREVSLEEPATDSEEGGSREEMIPHGGPGPDKQAGSRETEAQIQQALLKLPPVFREALILCDIQGHAYKEAAEALECSINTVASRLARARSKMAELLGYLKKEIL
jgi:RNA polymerase sigma-70 factor (ECF subfamily)